MSNNLDIFKKIESKVEFGISMMTLCLTTGPLKRRILISLSLVNNLLNVILSANHLVLNFHGKLTTNIMGSAVIVFGSSQIVLKNFSTYFYRENLLELFRWTQSLHNKQQNGVLKVITEESLLKYDKLWIILFKITHGAIFVTCFVFGVNNIVKGDAGVLFRFPFISMNFVYYSELMVSLQLICVCISGIITITSDLGIVYIGMEIMSTLDVLHYFILSYKDRTPKKIDFLEVVTRDHSAIIEKINHFNNAIYMLSFTQFVTSTLLCLIAFADISMNSKSPIGYLIALCSMSQLFLPCLFGEFIKIKTERLSISLYFINWYNMNRKDQNNFIVILGLMQRTYGVKAAGMYNVDIYTFIQIVKMASSYCAILLAVNN
ncbi:uncharacterized protein LOC129805043 [Phlebotomus papatasi]|uniref:Odorant receptor n=1 Tax=Phlebotomus papatasi TaxID=29031 RepID=A0A3F2ZEL3_PHLPP|nr:uncharacterized protein LOC129805043 [Phlebotomus papatasi]